MLIRQVPPFLAKLKVRDRLGRVVPFNVNDPQRRVLARLIKRQEEEHGLLWFLMLKSRQWGGSTLMEGLGTAHCVAEANARALVVAHLSSASKELFDRAKLMWSCLPMKERPEATQRELRFPNTNGTFKQATAGSVSGGRGMTLSFLHASEGAFFPGEDSFTSLLPTIPPHDNTILGIESTANGTDEPGAAFHNLWLDAVDGRSDFLAIFVGWPDDPECVRDPEEMRGIDLDSEERELCKRWKAERKTEITKAQLAWRRWCLSTKAQGYLTTLHREYPAFWDEAFVASGDPAFTVEEIRIAEETIKPPVAEGRLDETQSGFELRPMGRSGVSALRLWAYPEKEHEYYIGGDCARTPDLNKNVGDFSAIVIWDGTTGEQVASFQERCGANAFAAICNKLGRFYNTAKINIEITGGYGAHPQTLLRDEYKYPNFYIWKGKNDRINGQQRNVIGWETTWASRERMFTAFREWLRAGLLTIRDKQMVEQMKTCVREGGRVEITADHDDLLMAGLVGWIARVDYAPVGILKAYYGAAAQARPDPLAVVKPIDYFPEHRAMVQRILDGKGQKNDPLAGV